MRLKQKTNMMLKGIRCEHNNKPDMSLNKKSNGWIFWSVAAITAFTAVFAPYKPISVTICGCAIIGGLKSMNSGEKRNQKFKDNSSENMNQLTSQLMNVISTVKKEWEDFIEPKKTIVQNYIKSIDVDNETRHKLNSYTYITESIIFQVSDIFNDMNKVTESDDLTSSFESLKNSLNERLCLSIEIAVKNQIEKYTSVESLINEINGIQR